jgi:hypothetical protein
VLVFHKEFSLLQVIGIAGFLVSYSVLGAYKNFETQVDKPIESASK